MFGKEPVRRRERHKVKQVFRALAKQGEEMVKSIRHEVPAGASIKTETLYCLLASAPADGVQLFNNRDTVALAAKECRSGKPCDASADHDRRLGFHCHGYRVPPRASALAVMRSLWVVGTLMRVAASSSTGVASAISVSSSNRPEAAATAVRGDRGNSGIARLA